MQQAIAEQFIVDHVYPVNQKIQADIVITTFKEFSRIQHSNKIIIDDKSNSFEIKSKIIRELYKEESEVVCNIGIDPGKSIGVSIFLIGRLLHTDVLYSAEKLIELIKLKLQCIKFDSLNIKIGNGGGEIRNKIHKEIQMHFNKIAVIECVDERNTSIKINGDKSLHEEAAIRIGQRVGRVLYG
ncbi:MAG: hypothetical protein ACXAD7_16350 [Candidatus Kariarchaeaceae archaeon]